MSRRHATPARRKGGKTLTLCGCGTPTRDGAYVCDRCIDSMAADLRELLPSTSSRVETHRLTQISADGVEWCPWPRPRQQEPGLWANLQSVIAGERGVDYRTLGGGSGATEKGLVETGIRLDENATKRARQVERVLTRLVRDCMGRRVSHTGPSSATPAPAELVPEMARWLMWRLDAMALHPAFASSARDLSKAVDGARWSVMPLPNRQWLGPCGLTEDCTGSMFARRDETFATCNKCDAWIEAVVRRNWLIGELENRVLTPKEIADLYDPDEKVRRLIYKRIKTWAARGRLIDPRVIPWNPDAPACPWPAPSDLRFRFGDAFDLLIAYDNDTNHPRSTT